MGFGDTTLLSKTVFILLIVCFIVDLIGFAIPYWFAKEDTTLNLKYYGGLWSFCIESTGSIQVKICNNSDAIILSDWFKAVRAFSVLSWLFFLAALVLVIVFVFFLSDKRILYLVTICLNFVGAFCALIAFAVFAAKANETLLYFKEYSGAFALTIISFVLGLISGVLGILDYLGVIGRNRNSHEQLP